jgi:HPt (histidine-containing phosphotransfer) domain-containing protein
MFLRVYLSFLSQNESIAMQNPGAIINKSAALNALGSNQELLVELAAMYSEDAPELLQDLQNAINRGDSRSAHQALHSLRGLTATFYAEPVVELTREMEKLAQAGELVEVEQRVPRLTEGVQQIADELRTLEPNTNHRAR